MRAAWSAVVLALAGAACGGDEAAPTSSPGGSVDGIPAGDAAGFNRWLHEKAYTAWPKEPASHPSTGPHGTLVLTYFSPKLDASLSKNASAHPRGSAAVKEFLRDGQVTGWAAYAKTQDASDGGRGWYFYEVFSTDADAAAIEGHGKAICAGCHALGRAFVRSEYP